MNDDVFIVSMLNTKTRQTVCIMFRRDQADSAVAEAGRQHALGNVDLIGALAMAREIWAAVGDDVD